jgi:hypothetical protein
MIFTRGIARVSGRALSVQRANAALFGSLSFAPNSIPLRTQPRVNVPRVNGAILLSPADLARMLATEAKGATDMGKINTVIGTILALDQR